MASAIFILDAKGKLLITRDFRGDISLKTAEKFINYLVEEDEIAKKPVFEVDGISYAYTIHNGLYFLAVTNSNANIATVFLFLYHIIEIFTEYFERVEEESIRDNFVIIYELLDEMMDFGYPQCTDGKILKEFILQESNKLEIVRPPPALTNKVSWRSEGIFYKKNEIFLDVIEKVNLLINHNGNLLRSEIMGTIKMKSHLSGMPNLRLGLNDRVVFASQGRRQNIKEGKAIELEDVTFHQCVRLSEFESNKTISFIPPDKEFDLMTYRINTRVKPLFWIEANINAHNRSRVEYTIKARSQFKARSTATKVRIMIPVPEDADTPKFKTSIGSVKYAPERNCFFWSINQFQGCKEYIMRAHFGLPTISNVDFETNRPPIQVSFEIPYFTVSGIQVRYLKITEKSGYQALPWVRYMTVSGDYQVRT